MRARPIVAWLWIAAATAPWATFADPLDPAGSGKEAASPAIPAPVDQNPKVEKNLNKGDVFSRVEGDVPERCRSLVGEPSKGSSSGRLDWGETGAVRVYVDECYLEPTDHRLVVGIRIINEGSLAFTLDPEDEWWGRTEGGDEVGLVRSAPMAGYKVVTKRIKIDPGSEFKAYLSPAGSLNIRPILLLKFHSRQADREIQTDHVFLPPRPKRDVPPAYPEGVDPLKSPRDLFAVVHVRADGKPESVNLIHDSGQTRTAAFEESVRTALGRWEFEPALQDGVPVKSFYEAHVNFSGRVVIRESFPLSAHDLAERLAPGLRAFSYVVRLPSAGGFVIGGKAGGTDDVRGARALLVRYGKESEGGSWLSVTSLAMLTHRDGSCGCAWWVEQKGAAEDFLDWVHRELEVTPMTRKILAPQGTNFIPSGLLESPEEGSWRRGALRRLLQASIDADVARTKPKGDASVSTPSAPLDLPDEHAFLNDPNPLVVVGDVRPPELVNKVIPTYPENARRKRAEGKVILEAVIDKRGRVTDLRVLRSIPLLDESAMAAVCCWSYKPALVNGNPAEVFFTVVVDYSLR